MKRPSGQNAYDRDQELVGNLGGGSPTLRDQLGALFKSSPQFSDPNYVDGNKDVQGKQYQMINNLLAQNQAAAKEKLMAESPDLRAALAQDQKRAAGVFLHGGDSPQPPLLPGMKHK